MCILLLLTLSAQDVMVLAGVWKALTDNIDVPAGLPNPSPTCPIQSQYCIPLLEAISCCPGVAPWVLVWGRLDCRRAFGTGSSPARYSSPRGAGSVRIYRLAAGALRRAHSPGLRTGGCEGLHHHRMTASARISPGRRPRRHQSPPAGHGPAAPRGLLESVYWFGQPVRLRPHL